MTDGSLDEQQLTDAYSVINRLREGLQRAIKGRDDTIDLILAALLADGHVLIEDYPGSGKTTLAKTLGKLISSNGGAEEILPFRRIQFTPDMLPGDVLGVNVFDAPTATFRFVRGPVFAHILLADEINRTGPKVQAAFLECMAEKQVTLDNVTYPLDDLFFVIGTQNPLDMAGTYPLPLVQLDRFLLKIPMRYVDPGTELEILEQHSQIAKNVVEAAPVCSREEVLLAREATNLVHVATPLKRAIVDLVQCTRGNPLLQFGASTRAALMLQAVVKASALLQERDHATEDDLKRVAPCVLLHRLRFQPGAGEPRAAFEALLAPVIEKLARGAA